MKVITINDLLIAEQVRLIGVWTVRDAQLRRESLVLFIENYKLQEENRRDFNALYERFKGL